jgi:cytochrome bd ubiquinol oxidase subunit I
MDAEILHRIQFGFSITFHYIYPPLSIGLSFAILFFEAMYLKTKDPLWEHITKFWIRVFALTFALGVATGIPMVFSFGTNWARYSRFIGDVLGSALAAEGLFAFAMEAGFLGILLFGWGRVSPLMHFLSALFVALGAHFSGFWITCVNSWMQTPAGYAIIKNAKGEESAIVTNWLEMVLNKSTLTHAVHVLFSTWISGAFLIISISSYYILKKKYYEFATRSMKIALLIAAFCTMAQLASADHLARNVAKHNPEKFAAFEGVYKTEESTPIYAFGWVDGEKQKVYGLGVPGMLSFLVYRNTQEAVPGLDQFPRETWPNVPLVFQMYHLMIAMWGLLVFATCVGFWMWRKNNWSLHPLLLKFLIASVAIPQIASIAGWYAAEFGRQPWTVYKLLKTSDAYSSHVSASEALFSLVLIVVLYLTFFALFLFLLDKKIKHGPGDAFEASPFRDPYKKH